MSHRLSSLGSLGTAHSFASRVDHEWQISVPAFARACTDLGIDKALAVVVLSLLLISRFLRVHDQIELLVQGRDRGQRFLVVWLFRRSRALLIERLASVLLPRCALNILHTFAHG